MGKAPYEFGIKAGHIRQCAPHHSPGRRVLRWLSDVDHVEAEIRLKPFKFHIIKQVPRRTVDFEEKDSGKLMSVRFGISQKFAKRSAFIRPCCSLGNSKEVDDFSALLFSKSVQGLLLYF